MPMGQPLVYQYIFSFDVEQEFRLNNILSAILLNAKEMKAEADKLIYIKANPFAGGAKLERRSTTYTEASAMNELLTSNTPSRRTVLRGAMLAGAVPMVAFLTGPAEAKIAQTSVAYQPTPKDDHKCANCSLFIAPAACKSVDGVSAPEGWCKIWVKKPD